MTLPAFLHPFAPPTQTQFLSIVRGEGALVWDAEGREYVDGMASLWYCNVGHGRDDVVDAIAHQARQLAAYHCFAPFTNGPADALAERVARLAPMPDARVFFVSSGSEAVDSALKLARIAHDQAGEPDRDLVISRSAGYHGVTYGGTSAQGIPPNREGFGPLVPGFLNVPHHDVAAMAAVFEANPGRVAAVIVEALQGAGGVYPPVPGYLQAVRDLCTKHGAFLIADEVVCGFGRLGSWFGIGHYGVEPDMVTFAKAITSGYIPLGGVIVGPAVRTRLESQPGWMLRHGHTYSGHPTACAAGLACLDITQNEGLLARASALAGTLGAGLQAFAAAGRLAQVRGEGGVWGAVVREGEDAFATRDRLLFHGVIARPIGTTVAVCPPLVITGGQVDRMLEAFDRALPA